MKPKFAVIGDYESIIIYKAFSWDVFYVNLNSEEIIKTFEKIRKQNYEKIFVVEEVYDVLSKNFTELESFNISLIPLAGIRGSKGIGKQKYKKLAAIATGIKLE